MLSDEPLKIIEIDADQTICQDDRPKSLDITLEHGIPHSMDHIRRQVGRPKNHNRSRSDLGDSILVTEKWMRYEEIRHQESQLEEKAPLAEPESMCAISSLNLDNHRNGKFVDREDVKIFEENAHVDVCSIPDGPIIKLPLSHMNIPDLAQGNIKTLKRQDKRSSVSNFFNKISRAVLKPKNTNDNVVGGDNKNPKERFKMFGRRRTTSSLGDEKENIPITERLPHLTASEKRRSMREIKKQRQERLKSQRLEKV